MIVVGYSGKDGWLDIVVGIQIFWFFKFVGDQCCIFVDICLDMFLDVIILQLVYNWVDVVVFCVWIVYFNGFSNIFCENNSFVINRLFDQQVGWCIVGLVGV